MIFNSLLNGNSSQNEGGAVYANDSVGIIINCTMNGNAADSYGGAIRADGESVIDIYNSICWDNFVTDVQEGNEIALSSDASVNVFTSNRYVIAQLHFPSAYCTYCIYGITPNINVSEV